MKAYIQILLIPIRPSDGDGNPGGLHVYMFSPDHFNSKRKIVICLTSTTLYLFTYLDKMLNSICPLGSSLPTNQEIPGSIPRNVGKYTHIADFFYGMYGLRVCMFQCHCSVLCCLVEDPSTLVIIGQVRPSNFVRNTKYTPTFATTGNWFC